MSSQVTNAVKENVRAVLLSKTDGSGILVSQFLGDYKKIIHEQLMYRNMGFSNLEDFIKAIPDVCRLEYSDKAMAFKLYGISRPDMYVSSFVKKAEGAGGDNCDSRPRPSRGGGSQGKDKCDRVLPTQDLNDPWMPNNKGLFSLCFPKSRDPSLDTIEAVVVKFAKIGEVAEVNIAKGMIFVRYGEEEFAKTAVRMYGDSLGLKRAEERKNTMPNVQEFARKTKGRNLDKETEKNDDNDIRVNGYKLNNINSWGRGHEERAGAGEGRQFQQGNMKSQDIVASSKSKGDDYSLQKSGNIKAEHQVYIGNWPYDATENDLKQLVQGFHYLQYRIIHAGKKCFAFVDTKTRTEADQLISHLDKRELNGRNLQVRHGHLGQEGQESANSSIDIEMASLQIRSALDSQTLQIHSPQGRQPFSHTVTPTSTKGKKSTQHNQRGATITDDKLDMPPLEPLQSPSMPKLERQFHNRNHDIINGDEDDVMPELEPQSRLQSGDVRDCIEAVQLFVGNFPYGTNEAQLFELLSAHDVQHITIMNRNITNRSTYAFVTVGSVEQAQLAILALDQSLFNGRRLTVAMAHPTGGKPSNTGYNQQLAKITCTVGGLLVKNDNYVGRKVSVEAPVYSSQNADNGSYGYKSHSNSNFNSGYGYNDSHGYSDSNGYNNSHDYHSNDHIDPGYNESYNKKHSLIEQLNCVNPQSPPLPPPPNRSQTSFSQLQSSSLPPNHYQPNPHFSQVSQPHRSVEDRSTRNFRLADTLLDYMKVVSKLRGDDQMVLPVGTTLKVMITHVENDKIFWAQLLENSFTGPNRSLESLEQLTRDLQNPQTRGKNINRLGRCAAQFQGEWYRAWCLYMGERDGEIVAEVLFIDYGNRALQSTNNMWTLGPDKWLIPPMARPFKLTKPWPELETMVEKVITLGVVEQASTKVNYVTTVTRI